MRPRAVRIQGTVLGRGVPGAFWSPDLVVKDDTGMLFVLYRQSIPFARLLFAVSAAEELTYVRVTIDGWFRRGMRPYIEMSRLTTASGRTHRAYSRWVQLALAAACMAVGWLGL
jgi:heat shock protein HtpX